LTTSVETPIFSGGRQNPRKEGGIADDPGAGWGFLILPTAIANGIGVSFAAVITDLVLTTVPQIEPGCFLLGFPVLPAS
jgi:hypothetical protein